MDTSKAIQKNGYIIKNHENPLVIYSLSPILDGNGKILSKKDLILMKSELDKFGDKTTENAVDDKTLKDIFTLVRKYAFDTESSVFFHLVHQHLLF